MLTAARLTARRALHLRPVALQRRRPVRGRLSDAHEVHAARAV